jgi:hypothetical protein
MGAAMKIKGALVLLLVALFAMGYGASLVAQNSPSDLRRSMHNMILVAEDPMTGSYELNLAKSKFIPILTLKSGTVRIEAHEKSLKCVLDLVDAQGTARHGEWTAQYDGKDHPADMKPFADYVVLTKISADAFVVVYKKALKVILGEVFIFSENRKSLTVTQTEITADGQGFHNKLVYDRQ